jgi:cytoplasmic iron level regulating protein YaaA (DUF328/UPF0246 family)
MKIIISPSKSTTPVKNLLFPSEKPLFIKQTNILLNKIKKLNESELKKALHISLKQAPFIYSLYQHFEKNTEFNAFSSFSGLVFKQLNREEYTIEMWKYIHNNIVILDAFYGILKPCTIIKPYRLDFTCKIGINLYDFWNIDGYFKDEIIINLASQEYRNVLKTKTVIDIVFLQQKDNMLKSYSTYTKMARGTMLDFLIRNQISTVPEITTFDKNGYCYNRELSSDNKLVFIKDFQEKI